MLFLAGFCLAAGIAMMLLVGGVWPYWLLGAAVVFAVAHFVRRRGRAMREITKRAA